MTKEIFITQFILFDLMTLEKDFLQISNGAYTKDWVSTETKWVFNGQQEMRIKTHWKEQLSSQIII